MTIKNELIFDFDMTMPRILIGGNTAVIDNVKKIVMLSDHSITVDNGKSFTTITGDRFVIQEIQNGRMLIEGEIAGVEFYKTLLTDKD